VVKERSFQDKANLRARTEALELLTPKERICVRTVEMNTRLSSIFYHAELGYVESDCFLLPSEGLTAFDRELLMVMHRYMLSYSDRYHELMIEAQDPSVFDNDRTDDPPLL